MNINALKGLADWIAGKFGVDVVFSPNADTAWTDLRGKVIYLPTFVPDELTTALTALIDHEAEHLRISDPDTVDASVCKCFNFF